MKLEVGQKIGIYEVVDSPYIGIKINTMISCIEEKGNIYPIITYINGHKWPFSCSEVRKVGSLIVKRLK